MAAQRGIETDSQIEVHVDLDLHEIKIVSEEILDLHAEDVTEVLERSAGELALGLVVTLDIQKCVIGFRFDVLGADEAEIREKIAEVIGTIDRETALPLRIGDPEVEVIDAEPQAA